VTSIGSMPDWDDLRDSQIPTTISIIQDMLRHPGTIMTKQTVKQAKQRIKEAKKAAKAEVKEMKKTAKEEGRQNKEISDYEKREDKQERERLKREVKSLLSAWKRLKDAQHRELKATRRTRKRERKLRKREVRSERREGKRRERGDGVVGLIGKMADETRDRLRPQASMQAVPMRPASDRGAPPGSWPVDVMDQMVPVTADDVGMVASTAKYHVISDLQEQIERKEVELAKLHAQLAQEYEERSRDSKGPPTDGDKKVRSPLDVQAGALETEIDSLNREVQRLQLEADEEFAKELGAREIYD
jgi:hypothetical protein